MEGRELLGTLTHDCKISPSVKSDPAHLKVGKGLQLSA